jgi:uncharacterized membrane protein
MTRWFKISIVVTVLALGTSLYVWTFHYDDLPAQVPIHWNIEGEADGFVARENVLPTFLLIPGMMAGWLGLTWLLPRISPKGFQVEGFRATYDYLMALVNVLFAYLHGAILLGSLGRGIDIGRVIVGGIFLFFALLGNVLGKVQKNFWIGVRTPWTLASESVWEGTHRLAAWLFTLAGVVGVVMILLQVPMWICFTMLMLAALVPVVYSLVLYKQLEKQGRV